jgi:Carboxypeptidase regulatory-like domain
MGFSVKQLQRSTVEVVMRVQRVSLIGFLTFAGFCCAQTSPTPMPEAAETGIEGVMTVGPIHGGPVRPGIPSTKPLANATFVVGNETGAVAEFTTDDRGRFRVSLPPGHYTVTKKDHQKGIGRYGPFDVDVTAGQMTKVEWHCDTGMR